MRIFLSIILLQVIVVTGFSQNQYHRKNTEPNTFLNPIFAGDYPDPSILVDGNDFYVVHSSFEYYPGLTIWHSTDLINWSPITSALTQYVGSVWAPDLVKYDLKYYIYFPAKNTNYVITADSINGKWSDPIDLKIGNIDPGHVSDENGNRFLFFSEGGFVPLSKDGLKVIGEYMPSYDGWPIPREWSIECFCMEGPKLFKRGDYYYLTVAEGGTAGPATGHMVISARSKSLKGPWENSPYNPIIRTKQQSEQWWSVGHGTVFEAPNKQWYMIFHGYENGHYNMGRQTLLAPIEWTDDGWYKLPENFNLENSIQKPMLPETASSYPTSDQFEGNKLQAFWKFYGEFDTTHFELNNQTLTIKGKGNSVAHCSPLLYTPSSHSYSVQVEIETDQNTIGGLVLYYSPKIFSGILGRSQKHSCQFTRLAVHYRKICNRKSCIFEIRNRNSIVDFFYSKNGIDWNKIENSTDVSGYHHNVLSGFMSLRIGLVSLGEGTVRFKNFQYQPLAY